MSLPEYLGPREQLFILEVRRIRETSPLLEQAVQDNTLTYTDMSGYAVLLKSAAHLIEQIAVHNPQVRINSEKTKKK